MANKRLVVLDENPREYICCYNNENSLVCSEAFMVPKVQPHEPRHRSYRDWEEFHYIGSNNSCAKECNFWHERRSFVDELEPEWFLGDAVDEWRNICRGI